MNGQRKELDHYQLGKRDGVRLGWYEEGPKKFRYNYKNGVLDGVQTEWHLGGEVFRQAQYASGVEVAKKVLYSGGELFTNYVKRDGRTYGIDGGALCMDVKSEGSW